MRKLQRNGFDFCLSGNTAEQANSGKNGSE
jgi:hypothetical protein